ncbi:MAG TPA: zinc ribbon domain-containing protein [Candidatus Synoicihabitans sp.]|nr:zinc ribbon domain-containing protein [Candidatus Synoicihabitans sp.]
MTAARRTAPETCAICGADIPPRAKSCPECGADERTGWREQSVYDGIDLPAEAFGESERPPPRAGLAWYWVATGVLVVVALVVLLVAG